MRFYHVLCRVLLVGVALSATSCRRHEDQRKKGLERRLSQSLENQTRAGQLPSLLAALDNATPESLEQERLADVFVARKGKRLYAYWLGDHPTAYALRLRDLTGEFAQTYEISEEDQRENLRAAESEVIFGAAWASNSQDLYDALKNGEVLAELLFPPEQPGMTHETSDAIAVDLVYQEPEGDGDSDEEEE